MKKIIFILIISISIFLIYTLNKDKKIFFLSLGDELSQGYDENYGYTDYVNNYLIKNNKLEKTINNYFKENIRTIDLIDMIKNNKEIKYNNKKTTIQNSLIKADILTISIGNNDLLPKFTLYGLYNEQEIYNYIDSYLLDLDNLLSLIRKYCKEKIVFIGYYNIINDNELDKYYNYLINKVKKITNKYHIYYLDIYDDFNDDYRSKKIYPNKEGYNYIGQEIVKIINK